MLSVFSASTPTPQGVQLPASAGGFQSDLKAPSGQGWVRPLVVNNPGGVTARSKKKKDASNTLRDKQGGIAYWKRRIGQHTMH